MNMKQRVVGRIEKSKTGKRILTEQRYRALLFAALGFALNLMYAFYHGILGAVNGSLWFTVMCAYYIVLSAMRFSAVLCGSRSHPACAADTEYFVMRLSGALLIVLCVVLTGVIYISLSQNIATKYDEITMITIAAYTFCKITAAIIKAVKQHKNPSPILSVVRTIGYAEVAASVLTLQRSMLVSFGAMQDAGIRRMNACTGAAVCLFVLILGIAMIQKEKRGNGKMTEKSKLVKANEKIEKTVTGTFQKIEDAVVGGYTKIEDGVVGGYTKIEDGVVGGYTKIEDAVVGGYTKIEDAFVGRYLTKEGEAVEEAKKRIQKED